MSFVPSGTLFYIIRYNLCLLIQFTSLFIKHIQISILRIGAFVFRCKCIYFFKTIVAFLIFLCKMIYLCVFKIFIDTYMKSIEDSVTALPDAARRSIDDIKKSYPDEWILVGDPEEDEREMGCRSGIVLYHSPDKRELAYLGKPLMKQVKTTYLFFNRVTPRTGSGRAIVSIYSIPRK